MDRINRDPIYWYGNLPWIAMTPMNEVSQNKPTHVRTISPVARVEKAYFLHNDIRKHQRDFLNSPGISGQFIDQYV